MNYEEVKEIFDFVYGIIVYVLGGLAYKSLLDNYMGFIPFFGDFICKCKIADEYDSEYKKPFIVTTIISIVIIIIMIGYVIYGLILYFSNDASAFDIWGFSSYLFLFAFGLVFIIVSIINIYYTYKILYPLVQDITGEENVGISTFVFSLIQIVFYIWLIVKTKKMKEENF